MYKQYKPELNKNEIFAMMDCHKDSPLYTTYLETYAKLLEDYENLLVVTAVSAETQPVLEPLTTMKKQVNCLVTLPKDVEEKSTSFFTSGVYLEGLMLNTMAEYCLFKSTEYFYQDLKAAYKKEGLYLTRRYEPGSPEVPMTMQKAILQSVKKIYPIEVEITSDYMYYPVKSLGYCYGLQEKPVGGVRDHDCSLCPKESCSYRKYQLTIENQGEKRTVKVKKGSNLLDILRQNDVFIEANCGGKKVCGKCKVQISEGNSQPSDAEYNFLKEEERQQGIRLACCVEVNSNMHVKALTNLLHHQIKSDYAPFKITNERYPEANTDAHGIAVDIGTTTVVCQLVHLASKAVVQEERFINPQKSYGSDVVTRIQYAHEHQNQVQTKLIVEKLSDIFQKWHFKSIKEIVIAGNTTMLYLLRGLDPIKLAVSPFIVEYPQRCELAYKSIFQGDLDCPVILMPVISAFIGGDIVSGFYAADFLQKEGNGLFIDIGTNGEMAIKHQHHLLTASTAAGPAFEGANITDGMGSVAGAICEANYKHGGWQIKTIGDVEAMGINGSALIDITASALENGFIDQTGRLTNQEDLIIYENGARKIRFTQKDVRQIQLAKGAIAAGIEVLLKEANLTVSDLDFIYIAGGFGSHLNLDHAMAIGLLPKGVKPKIKIIGNSSLGGAVRYLLEKDSAQRVEKIAKSCDYLELSTNKDFNDAFIMHLNF